MGLDVYLKADKPFARPVSSGIFIREDGGNKEISRKEWDRRNPGVEPVVFSNPDPETDVLYHAGITHNLNKMADQAMIYQHLWRPDEIGVTQAVQLIGPLRNGLELLKTNPEGMKRFNPENGWGTYELLIQFVEEYLAACIEHPEAAVEVDR